MRQILLFIGILLLLYLLFEITQTHTKNSASYDQNPQPSFYVHDATSNLSDIFKHLIYDRQYTHLNGTPFSEEEKTITDKAAKAIPNESCYPDIYPPTQPSGIQRYLIANCAESGAAYILEYIPEYQDWDLHIYTPADLPEILVW